MNLGTLRPLAGQLHRGEFRIEPRHTRLSGRGATFSRDYSDDNLVRLMKDVATAFDRKLSEGHDHPRQYRSKSFSYRVRNPRAGFPSTLACGLT